MKYVIFSYNFLPQADAEAYCATRFASALAGAGHDVTVVTMDWPKGVADRTYQALVDDRLKIVRVPFGRKTTKLDMLRFRLRSYDVANVPVCVAAVKKILGENRDSILVTRSLPILSLMVGWYCRKYARLWISHLSDPVPFQLNGGGKRLNDRIGRMWVDAWMHRSFRDADATSVTCHRVCRYFADHFGNVVRRAYCFETTHIGDQKLSRPMAIVGPKRAGEEKILLHPGTTQRSRRPNDVLEAIEALNRDGVNARFVQIGHVDADLGEGKRSRLFGSSFATVYEDISPEKNVELLASADAVVVPDTYLGSELSYSPFILSKFVYQLFDNKPMVLYVKPDSAMADYARWYPEAGIFVAEADKAESLKSAIRQAFVCDPSRIDRSRIRRAFSAELISRKFDAHVEMLLSRKGMGDRV